MASLTDIVSSMRTLNLDPLSDSPKSNVELAKAKAANSQPDLKLKLAKRNPIKVPKRPSRAQSSKAQPLKSQTQCTTVPGLPSVETTPNIIDKAERRKTYEFQARAEPGAVPLSPKKLRRSPRNRTKRSNSAPFATQVRPSSQTLSSPVPLKRRATTPFLESTEKALQQTLKYVVQASGESQRSESIVGVYSELERANEFAKEYVKRWGIRKSEIVDIQSSSGCTARARRRSWQGGMSEIRVDGAWVKVFPKEFLGPASSGEEVKKIYLAVDRSFGLFVIRAFAEKEPAWEACKRYRDQLAYCAELEGEDQWVDKEGMLHSKGKIGGMSHHWSVVEYPLDEKA